jgi:hypothetical protein
VAVVPKFLAALEAVMHGDPATHCGSNSCPMLFKEDAIARTDR